MKTLRDNLFLRYAAAILVTTALMIWISVNERDMSDRILPQAAFWSVSVTAGWLQMVLISRGVRATFGAGGWPGWALLLVSAFVGAVPLTFEIRWLLASIVAPPQGLPPPWLTYLNVSVINLVFCLVQFILIERWPLFEEDTESGPVDIGSQRVPSTDPSGTTVALANGTPTVSMLSRRPDGLNGVIRYMQMEDHYLRVHTNEGVGITLHRMSDARRDLSESDGQQVHKSWWVSAAAISEIRHENRKRTIVAVDGTEIPVGRSFEPALKEAGWF